MKRQCGKVLEKQAPHTDEFLGRLQKTRQIFHHNGNKTSSRQMSLDLIRVQTLSMIDILISLQLDSCLTTCL